MAKKKIKDIIQEETAQFFSENGYELYNVEFAKEGKDWFLRVYIDFSETTEGLYIGTDDCEKVSRYLSEKLDIIDPIEQNYYLEVSSPGLDRVLLREKDYARFSGNQVEISLYKAIDGRKSFEGRLEGLIDGKIVITDSKENKIELPKEQVAKTKLKIIF